MAKNNPQITNLSEKTFVESTGRMESYTIKGSGKILFIGDTHFSAQYTGSHRNYTENTYRIMNRILGIIDESENVSQIVLLGDIIGVKERNIKNHRYLARVLQWFRQVETLTGNPIVAVKGNHDYGDYTDFELLLQLGYLINPKYVDYVPEEGSGVEVRFHVVNFGEENSHLELNTDGASNVVLAHNDFQIDGVTTWYRSEDSINLSRHKPFRGIDFVLSGHIHLPSPEVYYATIGQGDSSTALFYPGSPSRVSERIEDCFYVSFEYIPDEHATDWVIERFGLWPVEEEFYPEEEFISEEVVEEVANRERLNEILSTLSESRLLEGNLEQQIDKVPFPKEVRDKAKVYLRSAIG